jgi:hypothetical protein
MHNAAAHMIFSVSIGDGGNPSPLGVDSFTAVYYMPP